MGLQTLLEGIVRTGNLTLKLPGDRALKLGDGTGPVLVARITSPLWAARIAAKPGLYVGEAYMEGGLVLEQGKIGEFMDLIGSSAENQKKKRRTAFQYWLREQRAEMNARAASQRNVAHHYDLSDELYRRFLDADMQYSCAYFTRPDMTLEEAQLAKKRHIAAKLNIEPGMKVLDIGCGWGGLAMTIAEETGAEVHGVTLSKEQLAVAQARAEQRGLGGRARFTLTDYRDVAEKYDRIVSVGMFEHVGRPNYQAFFDTIANLMPDDGVALIHAIGRPERSVTSAWIAKYIFPGGYSPALSEIFPNIERSGLFVTDLEILRLHYAHTIRHWRDRFEANRAEIAELYDERFCRMWEFYLGIAEQSFRARRHFNWQAQLCKGVYALPITRDYIAETEARLAEPEQRVA